MKVKDAKKAIMCDECDASNVQVVQFRSGTRICLECLNKAVQLLEGQEPRQHTSEQIYTTILGAIDSTSAGYLAAWHLCDALDIPRTVIQGHKYPQNIYEQSLRDLIDAGTLEEVSDLSYRYQRVTTDPTPT